MGKREETEILSDLQVLIRQEMDSDTQIWGADDLEDSPVLVLRYKDKLYGIGVFQLESHETAT